MKTEREIAELIFDAFRAAKCRANHIVMMRVFRFSIVQQLNPMEQDVYNTALIALINLQYVTYEGDSPECLRLTEKGYNYIYNDDLVREMSRVPWMIPNYDNPKWEKSFSRFWDNMLVDGTSIYHIDIETFIKWIKEYNSQETITAEEFSNIIQKMNDDAKKEEYEKLINKIPTKEEKMSFYLCAQNYCEEKVMSRYE